MAKAETKEVALAAGTLPVGMDLQDILGDSGAGQNMAAGDLGIPYLALLQSNSPQCNPAHQKYIEGAQAGMFMNTATGALFGGYNKPPIEIIPCAYVRQYDEWRDRDGPDGGGFVASHEVDSGIMSKTKPNALKRPALENGNIIWETGKQFILLRNPHTGRLDQMLMTLKSTHLKANRRINNLINDATIPGTSHQAPRWLFPFTISVGLESKGDKSWFVPMPERMETPVSAEEYAAGKQFHLAFNSGAVNVGVPDADADAPVAAAEPGDAGGKAGDDKIPY
jgi:hypothetical protein